ncbi:hypothetical protein O6H91_14G052700 [Diphasiastrum complanatum]|uniref:Uncharacterized protein n=2 Tax=Diphasiastrum complanatum TaxID=34168 RepID=A0ACC2BPD6_DIPCM|nr:hypothetical protein O6H91_14G041900 [Diphasiastrum complanatum]KAJ7531657.1 hypothetical protein O6H91_14G052700 [Diphasiastrum complanatum]
MEIIDSARHLKPLQFKPHAWEDDKKWGIQYQDEYKTHRVGSDRLKKRRLNDSIHCDSPFPAPCGDEAYANYLSDVCPTNANFSEYNFGAEDMKVFVSSDRNQSCELKDTEEDIFNLMNHLLHLEPEDLQAMEAKALPGKASAVSPPLACSASSSEAPMHELSAAEMDIGRGQAYSQDSDQWSELSEFERDDDGESIPQKEAMNLRNYPSSMTGKVVVNSAPKIKQEEIQLSADADTPPSSYTSEESSFPMFYGLQNEEDYNGVRLVHLLVACAEAVSIGSKDLAAVILSRLHQLTSFTGTAMQRVASYFGESLQAHLDGEQDPEKVLVRCESMTGAFQILHEICPFIKFAHYTANQAILEAFQEEDRLHIVDFDIMEGLQWPPLMEALASRSDDAPALQITAVRMAHPDNALYSSTQQTGRRLSEFAESLGLPFTFHEMVIEEDEACDVEKTGLNVMDGEAIAINCMVDLPHMPTRSMQTASSFLSAVAKLRPKVITITEDTLLRSTAPDFSERFLDILHHYCAIFDSLESTLSLHNLARTMVETLFLAPRIAAVVTHSVCEYGEKRRQWRALAEEAGFQQTDITEFNHSQAKLLLSMFKQGFRVDKDQKQLSLDWGERSLLTVSAWELS